MNESVWPKYSALTAKDLPLLFRFLFDPASLASLLTSLVLIGIYLAGIFVRIPTLRTAPLAHHQDWWFLVFLDWVLTGGAFHRGTFFSLGLLAITVLGRQSDIGRLIRKAPALALLAALVTCIFAAGKTIPWAVRPFFLTFAC
jgi:hypothetical protein